MTARKRAPAGATPPAARRNNKKKVAKAPPAAKGRRGTLGTGGSLVLVVDDFHDNREMFTQYLSFAGYRVAEAVDGEDALAKARGLLPDVIVMDLSLPRLDGWEATRRLKKDPLTAAIPVIALTGHAMGGHAEGAIEAGCDAFVTKPCVPSDLEAKVRDMLERARTQAAGKARR